MSFSSEVKEELSKLSNLANKQMVKYELLGYLTTNHITIEKNKIKFLTENEYNINRFGKLISNLQYTNYTIEMSGKNFCITFPKPEIEEIEYLEGKNSKPSKSTIKKQELKLNLNVIQSPILQQELLQKAFVRGSFLGGGSINNPKNTNHLEILFSSYQNAEFVFNILKTYQMEFKILQKKNSYSLYTKDGNNISKFLALIQANQAVLKFEEIRVYRDIRNKVNRKVNCETANLNKTVNAAIEQIEDIRFLEQIGELQNLSNSLKEIAKLRMENPEASLIELGNMLKNPIGKSGVNHRLKSIQNIAEEIRKKQNKKGKT